MQRTVKGTRISYAVSEVKNDGTLTATLHYVDVAETDEKKAYRKAVKQLGFNFTPLKYEPFETLYILDDAIFFQYAKPVTTEETGDK